jgi:hypothetical protein
MPKKKKTNVGAIAGGAVGGCVILILIAAVLIYFCTKRKTRGEVVTDANDNGYQEQQMKHPMQHSVQHPMQQQAQHPSQRPPQSSGHMIAAEVEGESHRDNLAELPAIQSSMGKKSGHDYSVTSIPSNAPSTTYSPPRSPPHSPYQSAPQSPYQSPPQSPPPMSEHHYFSEDGDSPTVAPYGVPAYHNINPYPPTQPIQQPYPPMQPLYLPQEHYPLPQEYAPQYPPPQQSVPSYVVQGSDMPAQARTTLPRKEVGSVSSVGSSPRPHGDNEQDEPSLFQGSTPGAERRE